jgi:polysaccharide deacetylase 2 family uncharacterized protein YibQ
LVCAGGLAVWLGGCDKIASKFSSLRKDPSRRKEPARNRAPHGSAGPKLAIILDDLGNDREAAETIFALREPLTVSVLPFHPHSTEIAEQAKRRGLGVMLHLPMQAVGNELAEAHQLHRGMTEAEVARLVGEMLQSVPTAAGVNNHEGSLATTDTQLMTELMPLLKQRGLFFIDSRTTAATVAFDTAEQAGVRSGFRNVPFLDDVEDVAAIRKQMELAVDAAKEKGAAIAIGHPHRATLQVLGETLPELQSQGVRLVLVSDLVR